MNEAASICAQLSAASGFKAEHDACRGILDSRIFQIFEGANEMLYTQISDFLEKQMKRQKENNLFEFLSNSNYCNLVVKRFKKLLYFSIPFGMVQRQKVTLGEIIARLIGLQYVFSIVEKGYREDLYENCVKHIKMDIKELLSNLHEFNDAKPILNYNEKSDWRMFI